MQDYNVKIYDKYDDVVHEQKVEAQNAIEAAEMVFIEADLDIKTDYEVVVKTDKYSVKFNFQTGYF